VITRFIDVIHLFCAAYLMNIDSIHVYDHTIKSHHGFPAKAHRTFSPVSLGLNLRVQIKGKL